MLQSCIAHGDNSPGLGAAEAASVSLPWHPLAQLLLTILPPAMWSAGVGGGTTALLDSPGEALEANLTRGLLPGTVSGVRVAVQLLFCPIASHCCKAKTL